MSVASAQCQVVDGKPNADCIVAGASNSGMFVGADMTQPLGNVDSKSDFKWSDPTSSGILKPQNSIGRDLKDLNFKFDNLSSDIQGVEGIVNGIPEYYEIVIGTNGGGKAFLLNAGTNTLKSNLKIFYSAYNQTTPNQYYHLNAGGLNGSLTLVGNGNFTANITGSITGGIRNSSSKATLNFTSSSRDKIITLGDIFAIGPSMNTLIFSNVVAKIDGIIFHSGENNITLDTTALTLAGADNTIATFVALGGASADDNKLTITNTNTTGNTIINLALGDEKAKGLLTIENNALNSGNPVPLIIETFESKTANSTLVISAGEVKITNTLTGTNNNITLDSSANNNKANLTLDGGGNNAINTLTAIGGANADDNKLTITNTNGTINTITNLVLGTVAANGSDAKNGALTLDINTLTIDNLNVAHESGLLNVVLEPKRTLAIGTTTLDGGKILTLNIKNKSTDIEIDTLKTQNTNQIHFNKSLWINRLIETTGATKLTFVNKMTKDIQNPNKVIYGHLMIDGSSTSITNNPKLKGTYKMAIMSDRTIKSGEIVYDPKSTNNIAVATIKKHNGATSGSTDQAELRSQGVIDLGAETDMTLQSDFSLVSFNYYVAETELYPNGPKDYITYFIDGKGSGSSESGNSSNQGSKFQQDILSNIALSTTGLYLANFNSLNKRLGELRDNNRSQGIWARIFNGQQSNSIGLKSSANFVTVQAGYDYAFGFEGANNFTGFALSYSHSQSKFKDRVEAFGLFASIDSLRSDLVEVALYNAYVADSGWYNDTVAKFSYLLNQMGISGSGIGSNKGDINTYALTLSNEFGYRFKLGASDEWYIDPQAEVGFGYFEGQDLKFKESNSPLAKLGTMDSLLTLRGRVGASFGYDFKNFTSRENGLSAKLYLGVFGEFDYFNGGDVKFGGGIAENAIKTDARAVINVGTNLEVKDATRIYVDFESSFGGKITTDYKINAGVRYSFGENANYKSNNGVQKDNEVKEAPIKLQEEENEEEE